MPPVTTGLSGNEIFCLSQKGYLPGNLIIGNSVYALGLLTGLRSGLKTMVGGEVEHITQFVAEGRETAFERLKKEAQQDSAAGITGVTSQFILHGSNIEFLSIGSAIHTTEKNAPFFSTSSNGQELYIQLDAQYQPLGFVFGNVAYSIGLARGVMGTFKTIKRGEILEFSELFNHTRHLALARIVAQAKSCDANAVLNIKTNILSFGGVSEMLMIGTASRLTQDQALPPNVPIISSALSSIELWNLSKLGYMPLQLVLGTSVFSLGLVGGVSAVLKSFVRGEINELTQLIYAARERAIALLTAEAEKLNADGMIGIKTYVYQLGGGLVEFLAIGTAIKKVEALPPTTSASLPVQSIVVEQETFYESVHQRTLPVNVNSGTQSPNKGLLSIFSILVIAVIVIINLLTTLFHS